MWRLSSLFETRVCKRGRAGAVTMAQPLAEAGAVTMARPLAEVGAVTMARPLAEAGAVTMALPLVVAGTMQVRPPVTLVLLSSMLVAVLRRSLLLVNGSLGP